MCGRLVNLDTVARVLAEYYHLKTETQLAALDEALSKVPAVSVGGGHEKDHAADPGKMVGDLVDRQAALDAVNSLIDRFERILSDIRESKIDDSVCGMCEYDGAFVGQSGDWYNECPGFEKDNCFKLSDECRKRWLESVKLPSAQPQPEIKRCKDCKHWRDSDGVYRRGTGAESKCHLNTKEVYAGTFYCGYAERRTDE